MVLKFKETFGAELKELFVFCDHLRPAASDAPPHRARDLREATVGGSKVRGQTLVGLQHSPQQVCVFGQMRRTGQCVWTLQRLSSCSDQLHGLKYEAG